LLALSVTLVGFSVADGPCFMTGETTAKRLTDPVNPPVPVTVMVTDPEDPLLSDSEDELAVKVKPAVVVNVAP